MLARNTIAIFILLVVDTVLISLTAVTERCFECCMALVNFYHSYLFIWYVTQEDLRYMSQGLEKKHIRWILTPWKVMAAFSFIFNEVRAVPELLLGAYGSQGPWGTIEPYWPWPVSPHSPGDQLQLRGWHPVLAWAMVWARLSLTSPSGWSPVVSLVLPLALVCWMDLGSAWLLCLDRGCWWDSLLCWDSRLCLVLRACGIATLPVLGHLCFLFDPLMAQTCSQCSCRDSLYALWEIPREKFSQTI